LYEHWASMPGNGQVPEAIKEAVKQTAAEEAKNA
jgi:hypothetical protein